MEMPGIYSSSMIVRLGGATSSRSWNLMAEALTTTPRESFTFSFKFNHLPRGFATLRIAVFRKFPTHGARGPCSCWTPGFERVDQVRASLIINESSRFGGVRAPSPSSVTDGSSEGETEPSSKLQEWSHSLWRGGGSSRPH